MAELAANDSTDRVQKFFQDLETQKTILSSCTQLFTTLSDHFASLQDTLSQKSQTLELKLQSFQSDSQRNLESLSLRENSISERESTAAARVHEQKESALAEFQNLEKSGGNISESLKSLSRRMDSSGLLKFIISKRKESVSLRTEISGAILEAVDPPRLILDAVEEFLSQKTLKGGVTDKRWACGMLVQALFPEVDSGKGKGPQFARSVVEKAKGVAETWKAQLDGELQNGTMGPAEAVMFLQLVVGFGLRLVFDDEFLRKLVMEYASRRDMAKLAAALGFRGKMGDIVDELVKSRKEIEAIYFAFEAGLTERFAPVPLLKSYLRNSKKNATTILKNGNYSARATEESNNVELNSIKAIIKCVEDHKLHSEFSLDSLRKRAAQLETAKAEKKKSSVATTKPQNKRGHGASGGRSSGPLVFHPAKVAKLSNSYPSFGRRNTGPPIPQSPAGRYSGAYNYPGQSMYEGPAATPYPSTYSVAHSQSPVAISQQHYSLPVDNVNTAAGYRGSGAYGGQTSYGAYDYGSAAPSGCQPSSYTQ